MFNLFIVLKPYVFHLKTNMHLYYVYVSSVHFTVMVL